jgi:hypothetical protein
MHLTDKLSKAQQVVVVVATGLGLWVVGRYLVNLGSGTRLGSGHTYVLAPLGTAPSTPGLPALARVIIWLVIIGLWALAAIRVLQPPRDSDTPTDPTDATGHTSR